MLGAALATPLPKNRAAFTFSDLEGATRGRAVRGLSEASEVVGICTDSRTVEPGCAFVALVGEKFDGHDHLETAVERGAKVLIVSREVDGAGAAVLRVDDTEKALGALAIFHRRRWARTGLDRKRKAVVAITGSAGKTTTRHATASILGSLGYRVHASAGNLNNAIGVPLTLLGLDAEHDVAVVEVGTNHPGEIAYGASLTEPDVAVLTLVAEAHTEGLGTLADVAAEKGALFTGLRRWGVAIANVDDAYARAQLPTSPAKVYLGYGARADADVRLVSRSADGISGTRVGIELRGMRLEARVPLLGEAGAYASLAAVSVALALDPEVGAEALARALAAIPKVDGGRLAAIELGDATILIDDAYNANPASMEASIGAASEIARSLGRRLTLVLGEMFELGDAADALHARVGAKALAVGAGSIVAVSGKARAFVVDAPAGTTTSFMENADAAIDAVRTAVQARDVVLVKASNGVGLGRVVEALKKERGLLVTRTESKPFAWTLPGRASVVIGLGKSGVSAVRLLRRLGATVTATDASALEKLSPAARSLEEQGVVLAAGGHERAGLDRASLVVISPGVPSFAELAAAEARGAEVIGELELASRLAGPMPTVAITGSNGKSTTTLLVGELLRAAGKRTFVGGNLGDPPSDVVAVEGEPYDAWVLEVSSFQAERMPTFHPTAAALLNLSDNHLDRYDGFDAYARAKGNLFVNQSTDDVAVVPGDDERCIREAMRGRGRLMRFGRADDPRCQFAFTSTEIIDRARGRSFPRSAIVLAGDHNAANVCAALALVSPFELSLGTIAEVLSSFRGLGHRIAFVCDVAGVRYYDDSKGTNVGASVAAIRGLSETKIVLIAGGRDKMGSYLPLAEAMRERGRGAVLIGEAADRIAEALEGAVPIERAGSMPEAVEKARSFAKSGDAVLLSPACSSFDMFRDYGHRGDAFVEAVRAMAHPEGEP